MSSCVHCGTTLDPKMRIVRDSSCDKCGRDLHACVQCRFYDRHAHNQCREPNAEWVTDRDRRNFCDYFHRNTTESTTGTKVDRAANARSKLDQLFKPKGSDSE